MTDHKWSRLEAAQIASESAADELDHLVVNGQDNDFEGEIEETLSGVVQSLQEVLTTVRQVIRKIR